MEIIRFVQSFSNPVLDIVFQLITMIGEDSFFMIVIAVVYWCIDKKLGYRLGFVTLTSAVLNMGLKNYFKVPRPIGEQGIRSLRLQTAQGYSFPSGHSQNTATLWTFFMLQFRKRWLYAVGAAMILLVGLSRIYLGVHTPVDVIGGIVIGILWVGLWGLVSKLQGKSGYILVLIIMTALAAAGLSLFKDRDYYKAAGALTGLLIGYFIEPRFIDFKVKASLGMQFIKVVSGLAVLYVLRVLLKGVMPATLPAEYCRYLILMLWITIAVPLLIKHFSKDRM